MSWLSIQQAATELNCSVKHIGRMVDAGKLEYIDIGLGTQKKIRVKLPEPQTTAPEKTNSRRRYKPKRYTVNG